MSQYERARQLLLQRLVPEILRPAKPIQDEAVAIGIGLTTLWEPGRDLGIVRARGGWGPGSKVWWARPVPPPGQSDDPGTDSPGVSP
jgi:hypothetical protein